MDIRITPIDREAAEKGKWTKYRGVDLCIARANNTRFRAIFRRLTRPYQIDMDEGRLSEAISADLMAEALGREVLVDWKPFEVGEGDSVITVQYSPENAKQLLLDDPDCQDFVMDYSKSLNNYLEETKENTAGE